MTLEQRIDNLKQLVQDLPDKNQQLLKVITQHLSKRLKSDILGLKGVEDAV